jgi:class 3 adenylate cyclase
VKTQRALLVIADIGGYTRFMRLHRMSLAHAQDNTARLLEAMIDAVPRFHLVEIEGDAVFLFVPEPEDEEVAASIAAVAAAIHNAFHAEQQRIGELTLCPCDACHQIGQLTVKVVAHLGEVVEQTVRDRTTIAGPDVILVHRMLKNSVPVDEYVLMTAQVLERCDPGLRSRTTSIEEELEGLGQERLHYIELGAIAEAPPPPKKTALRRLTLTGGQVARAVPYLVGLKRPRSPSPDPEAEALR